MKKYTYFLLLLLAAGTGCKKELSFETGELYPVFIGNNCRISQILRADLLTGKGLEAHNAFFSAAFKPTATEFHDSLSNNLLFRSEFTYRKDSMFLTDGNFFVLDINGRVKEYSGLEDPSDPLSDTMRILFTYDTEGYLIKQDYYYAGIPVPLLQSVYSYANGNLVRAELSSLFPTPEILTESDLEYNNQPVNGFLYLFPDAYMTYPYHLSLDLGKRPANTVKTITTNVLSGGVVVDSYITDYKDYRLSTDKYVLEFFADGDYQTGLGIISGPTRISYACPL